MFNLGLFISEVKEFKAVLKEILKELIKIKSYLSRIEKKL